MQCRNECTDYFLRALPLCGFQHHCDKQQYVPLVSCFLVGVEKNPISILSFFQPKQIRLSSKTGIPLNVLPKKGLTAKQVERMQMINNSDLPKMSTQPRSKSESKEDKRARKQAIKEERKVN